MCILVNPLMPLTEFHFTQNNETTAVSGGRTQSYSKTGRGRRESWAVEMEKWWMEPKIKSFSCFFFFLTSLFPPSISPCQSFSPALSIMSGHCDFESVKQSPSGQAVPLLWEMLLEAGTMCELSAAIWLTTAVRQPSRSGPHLFTLTISAWLIGPKMNSFITEVDLALNRAISAVFLILSMSVCFCLVRWKWSKKPWKGSEVWL